MTLSMSVFKTTVIRTRVTARETTRTRIEQDVHLPVRKEIGDLVTGRRTSPDLPRNDYGNDEDDDDDDNDCYDPRHKMCFPEVYFSTFKNLT